VVCNSKATPPALIAPVRAGANLTFGWSTWPLTHKGPILTYMAPYSGDIAKVDLSKLEFFKVSESGLLADNITWATDIMNSRSNITEMTIPYDIKPGKYIVRHELITLHFATEDSRYMESPAQAVGPQVGLWPRKQASC
jgi:cellulase